MEGEFTLMEMFRQMPPLGKGIMFFMMGMSVYSLAVMFEKWFQYRAAVKQSIAYLPLVTKALKDNNLRQAVESAKKHPKGHLSRVMSAGLQEYMLQQENPVNYDIIGAAGRAVERETALVMADLKSKLGGLGTIGSTAPFVGLLGTVIGIVNAFIGMAASGSGGLGAVSAGIAEALINTAVGLFAAIPAVWAFNYFTGRVDRFQVEMSNSANELMDWFLKQHAESVGLKDKTPAAAH